MITLNEEMEFVEVRPGLRKREPRYDPHEFTIKEWSYEPGAVIKGHAHNEAVICRIIQGKLRIKLGDEEKEVGAGGYYYTPPGVAHEVVAVLEPTVEVVMSAAPDHTHPHSHSHD